ncbi:hypothetical protein B0H10DRAFT_1964296 [Mycena sp. CBHHK59/15]|nr:hypothetical protein B0H10DRAFT_1964296 [Mycena sp. CBHHK59/15]
MSTNENSRKCSGPNAGDGCNGEFPNKTTPGLCNLCQSLEDAQNDEARQKIEALPQCFECGILGKNIKNNKCGTCQRQEMQQVQRTPPMLFVPRLGLRECLLLKLLINLQNHSSASATHTPVSARQVRQITVCVEAVRHNKPIGRLGVVSRAFPESIMFDEMVGEVIKTYNVTWDLRCSASLDRWHGSLAFHTNSEHGTLGEFYDIHSQLHNSETFLRMPPKFSKTPQPAVALSFVIDYEGFANNHNGVQPPQDNVSVKAAKRHYSDSTTNEPQAKRHGTPSSSTLETRLIMRTTAGTNHLTSKPLTSTFRPMLMAPPPVRASSPVFLTFTKFWDELNHPIFRWGGDRTVSGRIYNEALSTSKDKVIFELDIAGVHYIAKRYLVIPKNKDMFFESKKFLESNVRSLHDTSNVLNDFYDMARNLGVEDDIHQMFEVQETFIAHEVVTETNSPSVASGVSQELLEEAREAHQTSPVMGYDREIPQIWWLIQRRNGNISDRWNLMNPAKLQDNPNKIATTVVAFSHFWWNEFKDTKQVLSQFQSTSGKRMSGEYGKLIFDVLVQNDRLFNPQRHGDNRTDGACTVHNAHQCNRVCDLLSLPSVGEGEDTDEDGDGEKSSTSSDED